MKQLRRRPIHVPRQDAPTRPLAIADPYRSAFWIALAVFLIWFFSQ
jgi:hypothetical protein